MSRKEKKSLRKRKKTPIAAKALRDEQTIFDELASLCTSAGYAHAIAYFSYRDNFIGFNESMNVDDMMKSYDPKRLIRTETSTLIGLMVKQPIDYTLPAPDVMQKYINATEALLEELHHSMTSEFFKGMTLDQATKSKDSPFKSGRVLREPIFYGGESAYSFQYQDFALKRYENDDDWLYKNKGFHLETANDVANVIGNIQNEKLMENLNSMRQKTPDQWTFLPGF